MEGGLRALGPLWLKLLADAVVAGDVTRVASVAAVIGLATAASGLLIFTRHQVGTVLVERTAFRLDEMLIELTTAPPLDQHEHPGCRDRLELLRSERAELAGTINALMSSLMTLSMLTGTLGLLISVHPALAVLPVFSLPSLIATRAGVRRKQRAKESAAELARTANHLFRLATTPAAGKELRTFGLGTELIERHRDCRTRHEQALWKAEWSSALMLAGGWAIFGLGYGGALFLVVMSAIRHAGSTTPGDVLMAFRVAEGVNSLVANAADHFSWLAASLHCAGRLVWLQDFVAERTGTSAAGCQVPPRIRHGIRLEDVGFTYPGTTTPVLQGVNLELPAGSTVALVGENGAGKSTLVKLLCRLYEPTRGRLTLDGTDLAAFDRTSWRRATTAGFQDFARFEFLLQEAVGVGDVDRIDDQAAVAAALRRARAEDLAFSLPSGFRTQLGRSFATGAELSIGEWQRVALARAMMRDEPLVVVLDEPTASLDAEAEHLLFEDQRRLARAEGRARGAITLLVTHRFSTVRMADLIVVVQNGTTTETGSHHDLMRAGGLYAELYEMQAVVYR
jgi:ATP-binding cassette, subfamily B, bacterial